MEQSEENEEEMLGQMTKETIKEMEEKLIQDNIKLEKYLSSTIVELSSDESEDIDMSEYDIEGIEDIEITGTYYVKIGEYARGRPSLNLKLAPYTNYTNVLTHSIITYLFR